MRRPHIATWPRRDSGSIAVEAALVLPILLAFFGLPFIYVTFYCREYSAAKKAAHDAALYLSMAPRAEMVTAGPDGAPAALTVAKTIMAKELQGVVPSGTSLNPDFMCIYRIASSPTIKSCAVAYNQDPAQTLIQLSVTIRVPYVTPFTGGNNGIWIMPYAPVPYVGN